MLSRLEKAIFYVLIFSIPFQTRLILRSWGIGFNEWNAVFLYWTDLLIFAVLGLWFLRFLTNKKAPIGTTNIAVPIGAARSTEYPAYHPNISLADDKTLSSQVINSKTLEGRGIAPPGSWMISRNRHFAPPRANLLYHKYDWFLIGFIIVSAVSVVNASNQILGFYQLLKLVEFSLLYFYVKSNFNAIFNLATAFFVFLISGIFQAILSIFQYIRQTDLGLRFLGETVLNPDLFNVAIFLINSEKIMRSYGTTPHPNVLAFFLFVTIFIFYFYCFVCRGTPRQLQNNNPAPFGERVVDNKNTEAVRRDILKTKQEKKNYDPEWCWGTSFISLLIYGILLFGFFFTFSRIIIFAWLVGFTLLIKKLSKRIIITTLAVVILFSVLLWPEVLARMKISPQEEALSLRGFYSQVAFQEKPFLGVGLGNFVNWLREKNPGLAPNLYQPVHNIYFLIFSETGILGLAAFLLFLFFLFKKSFRTSYFLLLTSILLFGIFDHFLWTLQQGQIIFWIILGLVSVMRPRSLTG